MFRRLRERKEWKFFAVLPKADPVLAWSWWAVLILRGALPAVFAVAAGMLVGAVQDGRSLTLPLVFVGVVFVLLQVLSPIHQAISASLGDRTAEWLYDRLTDACIRPPGMGHLEDPKLTSDLTVARDFDLGMTGPPLSISMDFIAGGLVEAVGGVASAIVLAAYAWWAALVLLGAWLATHWLLRESGVWKDRNTEEVRAAQRDAEYAYRLAVDPPASKELRLFGLADWTIDRFVARRSPPSRSSIRRHAAARAARPVEPADRCRRERARLLVARERRRQRPPQPWRVGGVRAERGWRLDDRVRRAQLGARRIRGAGRGGPASRARDGAGRRAFVGHANGRHSPAREIRFRDLTFAYPGARRVDGARALRPDDSRRFVSRHRRAERRRKDHAREAPLPALRPAVGIDRGGRRGHTRHGSAVVALADHRRVPGLHAPRASAARQRRAGWRAGRNRARGARVGGRGKPRQPRHGARARLRQRHRAFRRPVAARRARARACARSSSGQAWFCSTSRPRSSTCAARRRSSIGSLPKPGTAPRS